MLETRLVRIFVNSYKTNYSHYSGLAYLINREFQGLYPLALVILEGLLFHIAVGVSSTALPPPAYPLYLAGYWERLISVRLILELIRAYARTNPQSNSFLADFQIQNSSN